MLSFSKVGRYSGGKKLTLTSNLIVNESSLPSLHAEHLSYLKLIRSHRFNKNTKYDLMVLRFTRSGTLGFSRPCRECLHRLKKSNIRIKDVYYSLADQTIGVEKFCSMTDSILTKSSGGTYRKNFS
jgi:hypothetical protein